MTIFPTMRQLIHAAIIGISSHPRIKSPQIYSPFSVPSNPEEVKIVRYRAYGGMELEEPGLVCSVYPMYTSRYTKGTSPPLRNKAVELQPYTLGGNTDATAHDEGKYTIIVELSMQEIAIGERMTMSYDIINSLDPTLPATLGYHGQSIAPTNNTVAFDAGNADLLREAAGVGQVTREAVTFEINPAEEILREYMDLLRLVLKDLHKLRPYAVRSSHVSSVDYPTSTWTRDNADLLFHSAYVVWELSLYPPNSWKDIHFLPITSTNFKVELI